MALIDSLNLCPSLFFMQKVTKKLLHSSRRSPPLNVEDFNYNNGMNVTFKINFHFIFDKSLLLDCYIEIRSFHELL